MSKFSLIHLEPEESSGRDGRAKFRMDFLKRLSDTDWSRKIFASLPRGDFYIKDRSGLYVHASRGILGRLGLSEVSKIVMTTDFDHVCKEVALPIMEEDRRVVEKGVAVSARYEIDWVPQKGLVWIESSKFPLSDSGGIMIGLICVQREYPAIDRDGKKFLAPPLKDPRVVTATSLLYQSQDRPPPNRELARACGVSERQLARLFARYFYYTPGRFGTIMRIRIACKRLAETEEPICFIAYDCGFSDQSSFTNRFRCVTGATPASFRQKWRHRLGV